MRQQDLLRLQLRRNVVVLPRESRLHFLHLLLVLALDAIQIVSVASYKILHTYQHRQLSYRKGKGI